MVEPVDETRIALIRAIPQVSQAQYSLTDQLRVLEYAARQLGLYDASDYLRNRLEWPSNSASRT